MRSITRLPLLVLLAVPLAVAAEEKAAAKPSRKGTTATRPKNGVAAELVDLAGGRRVKVAWLRGGKGQVDDGCLMGFDTDEGKERVIVPAPTVCTDPYFSPDGTRIVFSSLPAEQKAYIVDWDGKNLRTMLTGRHFCVHGLWRDPATGIEWVYVSDAAAKETDAELVASGREKFAKHYALSVYRYKLNDLSIRELVWDKMPIGARAAVATDGTMMTGEIEWPNCGVITVPNGTYKVIGSGCNANLAPDGSGLFFNLIGDHRTITMYDKAGGLKAKIAINTMPGNEKDPERKVWRPRWSNDVRLFSVRSADIGPDGDICVGAFNETFTGVKNWVRVTDTADNDGCPLVWVEPASPSGRKKTK